MDVFETQGAIVVRLEMAGVLAGDLSVNVNGQVVKIRGYRRAPQVEDVRRLHQMEIAFGPFEASVRVGISFDHERVSAHLENGLLEVRLAKRQPRTVEVKTDE